MALLMIGCACAVAFLSGSVLSGQVSAQNSSSTSSISSSTIEIPAYVFSNNLRLGADSQDVKQLQILLNSSSDTVVAQSGTGSVGQETTYFGLLTQQAVMRFQQKFSQEILVASGVASPTGFVGAATRAKLNALVPKKSVQNVTTNVDVKTSTSTAAGFISAAIQAQEFQRLSSFLPKPTKKSGSGPIVSEALPVIVSLDQIVTITGSGFSSSKNSIISAFGILSDISSDGKKITFKPRDLVRPDLLKVMRKGTKVKIDLRVVVGSNVSDNKSSIILII